ncbi:hypothetical protein [Nocardia cyriacigeorgica]|uniref:hypothetical protein n=1 Tax=Nocardia cyriacigeorgica TaxID=135487 RepID=UPI0024577E9C|nr:hypothetical protein [Nocardia cyriacigeorgica]
MTEQDRGPAEWSATSRTGAIAVRTTEQGLPVGISIERAELRGDPDALAAEVLRLCTQAANRAGLARRAQLEQAGLTEDMLALMGLPTAAEVADQEMADEQDYDTEPASWLRPV